MGKVGVKWGDRAAPPGHNEARDRGAPWMEEKESRSQPPMVGGGVRCHYRSPLNGSGGDAVLSGLEAATAQSSHLAP